MLRMCSAPVDGGYIPEMMVVLAGAHTGAFDQAFSYRTLRFAKASRLGVTAYLSPYDPNAGPMSSQVTQRKFGRAPAAAEQAAAPPTAAANSLLESRMA